MPLATNCSFRKIEKEESVSVKFIIIREKKKSFFSSLLGFEANKKMKYAPDGKEAALTDSKRVFQLSGPLFDVARVKILSSHGNNKTDKRVCLACAKNRRTNLS